MIDKIATIEQSDKHRIEALKNEWAEAVGCGDPDSLDDWPIQKLIETESRLIGELQAYRILDAAGRIDRVCTDR